MLCEKCRAETKGRKCLACGEEIIELGPYCYLCGAELQGEKETGEEYADFDNRILCSDGACIGVINEQGVCKVCGKPYIPES